MDYYLLSNYGPRKKYHIGTQSQEQLWKFSVDIVSLLKFAIGLQGVPPATKEKFRHCLKFIRKTPDEIIQEYNLPTRDANGYSARHTLVIDVPEYLLSVDDLLSVLETAGYTIRDQHFQSYSVEEMWDIIIKQTFVVGESETLPKMNLKEYYQKNPVVLNWNAYEFVKYEYNLDGIRLNPIDHQQQQKK